MNYALFLSPGLATGAHRQSEKRLMANHTVVSYPPVGVKRVFRDGRTNSIMSARIAYHIDWWAIPGSWLIAEHGLEMRFNPTNRAGMLYGIVPFPTQSTSALLLARCLRPGVRDNNLNTTDASTARHFVLEVSFRLGLCQEFPGRRTVLVTFGENAWFLQYRDH